MPAPLDLRNIASTELRFRTRYHKRMARRSMSDHVGAMRRYRNAVADLL
jgi:hypothetical protein